MFNNKNLDIAKNSYNREMNQTGRRHQINNLSDISELQFAI